MTEFEEIDGKLQLVTEPCVHDWSDWDESFIHRGSVSTCKKCKSMRVLQPLTPKPLPEKSRFSTFWADWKASNR